MTSHEYQRLIQGESDHKQIESYTGLKDAVPCKEILNQQIRSMAEADTMGLRQAMDRSALIRRELVWEKRREMVTEMNRTTLDSLAKHYGISPGAECVRDHPDADDLDKGLLLARLRQFLVWDVEYLGTAPEMLGIDVEAAIEAAKIRKKSWQPSDTETLETVLRNASTCKTASDSMLIQALKECIAVTCVCPALKKKLTLKIKNNTEEIDEFGDPEDYEESDAATASLESLRKARANDNGILEGIQAYVDDFSPGNPMPKIVEEATDRWFASQFTQGSPLGSKVRMAWLLDVFQPFWSRHQSSYLASDPGLKKLREDFSEKGASGAAKKADKKWRRFTTLFVEYVTGTDALHSKSSPEEINVLVDSFGEHLISNKTRGASDSRTVAPIRVFLSTLMVNMDREGEGGSPQTIHNILHNVPCRRRRDGTFGSSAFTSLTVDTVAACIEILRVGMKRGSVGPDKIKGQHSKRKR
jgi:hypothetical protein